MDSLTCLPWYILTLLWWLVSTDLVRDCDTLLPGYRDTLLLRNIITHGVGHLLLLGLGHVLASLIGVCLAGTSYGSPDLVILCGAHLCLCLFVLCVPKGGILCPTLYRPCQGGCLHRRGGLHSSILGGAY